MPEFHGAVTGRLQTDYTLQGDRFVPVHMLDGGPIAYVDRRWIEDDEVPTRPFAVGSYRFYPLGQSFARNAVIAAHISGPLWWLPVLRYLAEGIGKRLLATAYIWGLANCPFDEAPTWRSVHLIRRLAARLGK